jgi:hypothetical protein
MFGAWLDCNITGKNTMKDTITERWLDRVNNLLEVQKAECLNLISATFTQRELIELKMMIETLAEMSEEEPCESLIENKA